MTASFFHNPYRASNSLWRRVKKPWILVMGCVVGLTVSVMADIVLVEENFGGDGLANLNTTTADSYHSELVASGGSPNWAGSGNVKTDGLAYGNNIKVTYLNLGTYIDDAKGTANGRFDLSGTISDHPTEAGTGYNFLSFANVSSPAAGTNGHTIGSIGTTDDGDMVVYAFDNGLADLQTKASTIGPHTVTISLDVTPSYYNGTNQFGRITLADSIEGVLGSNIVTADQSFAAISLLIDGTGTGNRTGTKYSALTLTQIIPEPPKGTLITIR